MKRETTDVLIIGAGIAGLTAAIHAADRGKRVMVINRSFDPEESNTRYAQGGIVWWGEDDSSQLLAHDIDEAGDEIGRQRAIEVLSEEGAPLVGSFLIKRLNVPFDKDSHDGIERVMEAAHSRSRIIHVKDQTGAAIQSALVKEAKSHPFINILSGFTAVDFIRSTHPRHTSKKGAAYETPTRILGVYVLDRESGEVVTILAHYTIVATGGIGMLFERTTNPDGARGDGLAMVLRAGAQAVDLEYVQFHPTAFRKEGYPSFLISEAVRGEGAILLNERGERFMERYAPNKLELAPRDEVARAIYEEMASRDLKEVYLNCDPIRAKGIDLEGKFPKIFAKCLEFGVDMRQKPIPVSPAAHYLCGGIRVDEWGRTDLVNLYVIGESSCTGLHGANRLASTSLLEGLVWGKRSAENICGTFRKEGFNSWQVSDWDGSGVTEEALPWGLAERFVISLRHAMWTDVGIVRSEKRLFEAWRTLSLMRIEVEGWYWKTKLSDKLIGLRNMLQVAIALVESARRNRMSRGCHFREDERVSVAKTTEIKGGER